MSNYYYYQDKIDELKKFEASINANFKYNTEGCKFRVKQEPIGFEGVTILTCNSSKHRHNSSIYAKCEPKECPLSGLDVQIKSFRN